MINNLMKLIKGFTDLPEEQIKEMDVKEANYLLEQITEGLAKGKEVIFTEELEPAWE